MKSLSYLNINMISISVSVVYNNMALMPWEVIDFHVCYK
jgi:hypothetical protein